MRTTVAVVLVALGGAALGTAEVGPEPYWKLRGCEHRHRYLEAHAKIRALVRNHRPAVRRRRVRHFARCVADRGQARALEAMVRASRRWRRFYEHLWPIRLNRMPAGSRAWARATAWCESRMQQHAVGAGGLYWSYFQWAPSTWYAAGGDRWPQAASYAHQAVLAIKLAWRDGTGHWPVCG